MVEQAESMRQLEHALKAANELASRNAAEGARALAAELQGSQVNNPFIVSSTVDVGTRISQIPCGVL